MLGVVPSLVKAGGRRGTEGLDWSRIRSVQFDGECPMARSICAGSSWRRAGAGPSSNTAEARRSAALNRRDDRVPCVAGAVQYPALGLDSVILERKANTRRPASCFLFRPPSASPPACS